MVARLLGLAAGLALAATATAAAPAIAAPRSVGPSAQAVQAVTDATTGLPDASALVPTHVCPPPAPGRATCFAQAMAVGPGGPFAHPRVRSAASPGRVAIGGPRARVGPSATAQPALAAAQPQPGTPAYLQQAYDLSYLAQTAGAGDTVAIVDAYNNPTAEADLATYRAKFGLPPCTSVSGCFRKVDQTGGTTYPSYDAGWATEIALDLDAVSALCPQCKIVLVEANSSGDTDLSAAQAEAKALGAKQISDSWGYDTTATAPADTFTFPGVDTIAATGDNGYVGAGWNSYPAGLASVTAAGGTTLTPASGPARGYVEGAWSGAGSGCDTSQSRPSYQPAGACAGRAYADLSAVADPNTGLIVYNGGQWMLVGGTSAASPLIAAYYALTGGSAHTSSWAYQHQPQLNDPTTGNNNGSNNSCDPLILYICFAQSGYDGPTGAGSISGAVVAGAPGIGGPSNGTSDTATTTDSTAALQGGIYPNGSDTTWWVQYGPTAAYGQQTPAAGVGTGPAPVAVAATLSGLSTHTAYHYRLVAQNAYGTTYGYDYTLVTTAPPVPTVSFASATVSGTSATLTALVNPQGTSTTYRFDYGTTPGLGQSTPTQTIAGSGNQTATASLAGLAAQTTYYFQIVAGNQNGTASSGVATFTSGAAPTSAGSGGPTRSGSARLATIASGHGATGGGVSIGNVKLAGTRATVQVTCHRATPCRVRARLTVSGRTVATATLTVAARTTATARLRLSRRQASTLRAHPARARAVLLELLQQHYLTVATKSFKAAGRP